MAKVPAKPEEIFQELVNDYQEIFSADLLAVILYGSGARGDYIPKKSDINFLIILTEEGISSLGKALKTVTKWHKRRVSTPLFITKNYIMSSLDSFPIEFLNLKNTHKLVYGEDVLQDLAFDKKFLRLQCERELKGKLLQLRENFLETQGNKREVMLLIAQSLPTFLSIFQGILFLQRDETQIAKEEVIQLMAQQAGLDRALFMEIIAIKEGKKKLAANETVAFMERYIEAIRKLSKFVDEMTIEEVTAT